MSFRNRLILSMIALFSLAFLVGCGSTYHKVVPPPSGSFSNSNLKGSYVFSVIGSDSSGFPLEMAGILTADGGGNLTGGTFDMNIPNGVVGVLPGVTIGSGSTYAVGKDGRATATFKTTQGNYKFDFVLTSSEHGLITFFDAGGSGVNPGGTGSGTLDLQVTTSQAQLAGSYVLSLTGFNSGLGPLASLAGFTLDGNGNITAGVQDVNNNTVVSTQLGFSGTVLVGAAGAAGTALLSNPPSLQPLHFDVFAISPSHLKFVETDGIANLVGEAFPQQTSVPTGTNVFTVSGEDFIAASVAPFVAGGFIVTNGTGGVSSTSIEDINDGGAVTTGIAFSGLYDTALTNGRGTMTLTGFNNASGVNTTIFAAYPSVGGLQLLEIDGNGITAGVASLQSSTTVASAQGYGLNLTGINSNGEEDDIAEFTNTSGTFSGLVDYNDEGQLTPDQVFTSTYTADSTGRGQALSSNSVSLLTYVVDSTTTVFIEQDSNQVGVGAFQLQTPSAKSNLTASHLAMLRLKPGARKAVTKRH